VPKSLARASHESIAMESADKRNYIATIAGFVNQQLSVQCVEVARMTACDNMHLVSACHHPLVCCCAEQTHNPTIATLTACNAACMCRVLQS
jgi:hypothetical protein